MIIRPSARLVLQRIPGIAAMSSTRSTRSQRLVPVLPCPAPESITFAPSSTSAHPLEDPRISHISPTTHDHLRIAADHLRASRLVAFPTETVYGLGANTLDPVATAKVYALKGRPADNPLIVHVSSLRMLRSLIPVDEPISDLYLALIDAFWPGPLTLLFPARNPPRAPPAPQTIGIRLPSHPLARALITEADLPISAPSANSSGRPSPTEAAHVFSDLGRKGAEPVLDADGKVVEDVGMLGCILDAGSCDVGVESTVVDGTQWSAEPNGTRLLKVLRPGGVGVEQIEKAVAALDDKFGFVGEQRTTVWVYGRDSPIEASRSPTPSTTIHSPLPQRLQTASSTPEIHNPSTPGMKYKHYSPSIPVYLLYPNDKFPMNPLQDQTALAPAKPEQVWKHIADQLVSARADTSINIKNGSSAKRTLRFGVMAFDDSSLRRVAQVQYAGEPTEIKTEIKSLGLTEEDAARALFRDMLAFEGTPAVALDAEAASIQEEGESSLADTNGSPSMITSAQGVDAILIEACLEKGVGLAVMERVNKAVGGGGSKGLGVNGASGSQKRFWVDVSP
jgi:L-threonylcarbamoyladenylate synthase